MPVQPAYLFLFLPVCFFQRGAASVLVVAWCLLRTGWWLTGRVPGVVVSCFRLFSYPVITFSLFRYCIFLLPLFPFGGCTAAVSSAYGSRHTRCSAAVVHVADGRHTITLAQ